MPYRVTVCKSCDMLTSAPEHGPEDEYCEDGFERIELFTEREVERRVRDARGGEASLSAALAWLRRLNAPHEHLALADELERTIPPHLAARGRRRDKHERQVLAGGGEAWRLAELLDAESRAERAEAEAARLSSRDGTVAVEDVLAFIRREERERGDWYSGTVDAIVRGIRREFSPASTGDREQTPQPYPWLTIRPDGSMYADMVETTAAEANRRLIIMQELQAGRLKIAGGLAR